MALIYRLRNKVNGKCYVGQTMQDLDKRLKHHKNDVVRGSKYAIHRAIRKYGWKAFNIISWYVPDELVDEFEVNIIAEEDSFGPNGYNMTKGGGGCPGFERTDEYCDNMSVVMKDVEHDGQFQEGHNTWNKGKKWSEESKERMSEGSVRYHYIVITPKGQEVYVENLSKYCKTNTLCFGHMNKVANGREGRKQHKGYTVRRSE